MKLTFLVLILALLKTNVSLAQNHDLQVSITNLRNSTGQFLIAVYNSADGFPKKPEKAYRRLVLAGQQSRFIIGDLPSGQYAVAIIHDENSNGKVDTGGPLGIPTEGIGFSRNPNISFGPPSFDKAAFTLQQDSAIEIRTKYY
jgi:uncharacterized protein (DUF2141 family)